jgi:hypothetical protein
MAVDEPVLGNVDGGVEGLVFQVVRALLYGHALCLSIVCDGGEVLLTSVSMQ